MHALLQSDAVLLASAFAQSWSLESVLQARGLLDDAGRLAVADALEHERREANRTANLPQRELVERLGLVQPEQVDAAQRALLALQGGSGRCAAAWCSAAPFYAAPEGPPWAWLVTGMDAAQRDRWATHCARIGLPLAGIYPRGGVGAMAWPDDDTPRHLIERQHTCSYRRAAAAAA